MPAGNMGRKAAAMKGQQPGLCWGLLRGVSRRRLLTLHVVGLVAVAFSLFLAVWDLFNKRSLDASLRNEIGVSDVHVASH